MVFDWIRKAFRNWIANYRAESERIAKERKRREKERIEWEHRREQELEAERQKWRATSRSSEYARIAKEKEEHKRIRDQWEKEEAELKARPYRIGNEFEDYVKGMFPRDRFELLHRTPTHEETGGRYVHEMIYPDLRFKDRVSGERFWVEVKYRSHTEEDGSIEWCAENQLTNYKRIMYRTDEKVFIMIGVGGDTKDPEKVYCLDLQNINFTRLFYGTYRGHRLMFDHVESFRQLDYIANGDNKHIGS